MLAAIALLFAVGVRPSPVEVVAPAPPVPVVADGRRILGYELHVTNFGATPLVLQRIEVEGVGDFSGDALKKMLRLVGEPSPADVARLDPGRRLIAFLWIALPLDAKAPRMLTHRLTFDTNSIDGIVVPVRQRDVPLLAPPFADGEWLAGNGPSNDSVHRRSIIALEGKAWIAQRYAIDWVRVGPNGDSIHDSRERNENFWAYGQPVHAVAAGEVTEAVDIYPDNKPGTPLQPVTVENILGNHVIERIGPDTYAVFAHLQAHSVRVHTGEKVARGTVVGKVGNSGNTTAPHLHLEVVDRNSAIAAEGIPFLFDRFTFIGRAETFDEQKHPNEPRRDEMPVDGEVMRFGR